MRQKESVGQNATTSTLRARRRELPDSASEPLDSAEQSRTDVGEGAEPTPQEQGSAPAPKRRSRRSSAKQTTVEVGELTVSIDSPQNAEKVSPVEPAPVAEPLAEAAAEPLQTESVAEQPSSPTRRRRSTPRRRSKPTEMPVQEAVEHPVEGVEQVDREIETPVQETRIITEPESLAEEAMQETAGVVEITPSASAQSEPSAEETISPVETVVPSARRRRRARRTTEPEPKEEATAEGTPEQRRRRREGVRLGIRQGHPEIIIDGEPVVPLFFFGNIDSATSERRVCEQIRQAASAGVHLHILLLELPVSVPMVTDSVNEAQRLLHLVRQHDAQGYVMFRVVFTPPLDWQKLYPEAMTTYADGSTGEPSFASDRYWQGAEAALTLLVRQLEVMEESRAILGYHLDCREWFYEYQRGYDYSPAAQEAFRQWLRGRYKNDVVALRTAWHDGSVTFTSASVPTYRGDVTPVTVLYEYRKGQRYVDYLQFASEIIARRIISLSRTVKKNSENRRLVAVSYGYVLDFPVPHSGHLALSQVLSAQSIDLICAPVSYRDRRLTQPGSVPVPVASARFHGKVFVLEDDTKPHTAQADTPDDYNPRCPDAETTRQVRLRNAATALVHHADISWMDLWGEGWVDDKDLWREAQKLSGLYSVHIRRRRPEAPEVAVLVDEHSLARIQSPRALLEPLVVHQQEVLARAGIHYGVYLQSDLVRKAFPDAKMYLFLNPIQVDSDVREAIRERLQRDGKTLVWLYAVALYDENAYTPDGPRDVAGIAIKAQPWNSEVGSVISNDRHPISERLRNKQVGVRERINPSFYVLDEKAIVLGEYIQTSLPSLAVKDMGTWRSVFIGERQLTVELLRGLCRYAGVHVWSQSSDVVRVAPPLLAVHSVGDGVVHLQFPQKQMVYDLMEARLLAEDANNLRLNMRTGQNGLYAIGTTEQIASLDLPVPERPADPLLETAGTSSKKRRRRSGRKRRKRKE